MSEEGGQFDEPRMLTPYEDAIDKANFASREVALFFRGRTLPTHVITPKNMTYYRREEDIPLESIHDKTKLSKGAFLETRSSISNEICKPDPGEPPDSSFKFVPGRGMYVKVIRTEESGTGADYKETRTILWEPYNDIKEDTKPKEIRTV